MRGGVEEITRPHAMVASSSGGYKQGMQWSLLKVLDARRHRVFEDGAAEDRWDDDSEDNRTVYGERVILRRGLEILDSLKRFFRVISRGRSQRRRSITCRRITGTRRDPVRRLTERL